METQGENMLTIDDIKIMEYDTAKYPFKEIIQNILEHEDLEKFHETIKGEVAFADQYNDQDTDHYRKSYSQFEEKLIPTFHKFVSEFVRPLFEQSIIFQVKPTFRCNIPGNRAVPYHRDSDFNHASYERNFWLPFTDTNKSNTIIIESEREKKDFKPYVLNYGQILFFDGANLEHGNEINDSNETRLSMDFRVTLEDMFEDNTAETLGSHTKMILGEYWKKID